PRQPWFAPPPAHAGEREAVVVGAGLAGCAAADSLAARGWRVTVVDRHGGLAAGASGNPQGVLYARLAAHDTALRRLVLASYPHALRRLALALPEGDDTWRRTGVLQLAFDAEEAARQSALAASGFPHALFRAVSRDEGAALADVAMPSDGLFFPGGGWVHPPALCRALADHPAIDLRSGHVTGLARAGGRWRVLGAAGELASAPVVILAAAQETASLDVTRRLPLRTIAGQITEMPATAESARLATVVTGKGYVAPARRGRHTVGATHRFGEASTDVRAEEHAENIAMLATLVPNLFELARAATLDPAVLAGRAGVRCTSPDTLPIVGPLADAAAFERTYAPLARDASLDLRDPAPWLPGLAITTAHGSRGLVTAMLAAEIVADALESAPGPVPASLLAAVHPNRFALRALVRRERRAPA
ncbi:MAG: FAD-dependent 5-carboxymethylaminomethyl-2-thiouridine(34) oxidoreductase MnmC, partial [Burkholderiales bacterium]|nr:FAD-dependent 5-carboxymethylaminomethyl-2-thiouridine(34) oxidoreductase MnmC [Burkholderiales bacterium]